MRQQALSLKARALAMLARREHSRAELRRKLLPYARAAVLAAAAEAAAHAGRDGDSADADDFDAPATDAGVDTGTAGAQVESAVEALLDWLQEHRYLSEQRFAESRVHARAGRFGNLRIRQELAQHGVALDAEAAQQLRDSELDRCRAVWARKFGELPADAAARARQMRFLAGRGFGADVIRRVLQPVED